MRDLLFVFIRIQLEVSLVGFSNEGDLIRVQIPRRENHAHLFKKKKKSTTCCILLFNGKTRNETKQKIFRKFCGVGIAIPLKAYMREKNRNSLSGTLLMVTVDGETFRPSGSCCLLSTFPVSNV
jgi:hypothetical protein